MSGITVLAIASYLLHSVNASPLPVTRRIHCYSGNACSRGKLTKAEAIILCVFVGVVALLIIASYLLRQRSEQRARPWMRPLQARSGVVPSEQLKSLPYKAESQKDTPRPYNLSDHASGSALAVPIIPPPAYIPAPAYKLKSDS
ncbi:hypothetical protein BT96DRAFT_913746 [Gymnopus androsaceus JB14]|uniref:Uncharacterized protein n=1 Tax=Gymnopus androsaceus JB14 TaxID=1447944 RepID=A0A6A4IDD7_9AGAR|nr:hypothetical protein BT96DRAFT_913746 [Gymnopus androsaceus JB14]